MRGCWLLLVVRLDSGITNDTTPTIRVNLTGTNAVVNNTVQLYNGNNITLGSAVTLTQTDINNGYKDITTLALSNATTYNFRATIST
jgi:large repetitive protein